MWVLCVAALKLEAQSSEFSKPSPYLIPDFESGILYYQQTEPQTAELNYHKISEEMVIKHRDLMVPINDIQTVDSIRLANRLFIKKNDKFYELLSNAAMQLLVQHRATSQRAAKTGAYGSKAHTGGVASPLEIDKTIDFYALHWPDQQDIVNRTEYWVVDGETWHKANSLKQWIAIFPDKKKQIRSFVSEHGLKVQSTADMKKILDFALLE